MKLKLWAAISALLAVPALASAQHSPHAPDPADPRVAVPPAPYESAFASASLSKPEQSDMTPDKIWRTANDTVAGAPGHAGHGAVLPPASSHAHAGHPAPAPAAKPAVQPAADPGKHH